MQCTAVLAPLVAVVALTGCQADDGSAEMVGTASEAEVFAGIAPGETVSLVGTEPFWGGTVKGDRFVYTTLENEAGSAVAVRRFAGNGGLGFSGTLDGKPLDLAITPGECSDGMSDRRFPYVATLRIAAEQRNGCAYTDRQPFTGPANP